MEKSGYLGPWDWVAIALYFSVVLAVGFYSLFRANRGTVTGYFLAGRHMLWLPVGASLFASNIGSEHFIGLAGSGAAAGIAVGAFELNAAIVLQLLGWVMLPVYIASKVCTLPEYMKKRFGGNRIRIYLAFLSLVLYIFTKISVNLYSGALFIQQALGWNIYLSVILLLIATAITTVTGGLAAVIYTDTVQTFVMITGAVILTGIGFSHVGGYEELHHKYMTAIPNTTLLNPNATCGYPRKDSWIMLRDPSNKDMPWPGFLLGQTPASIWYWCADQMMVQRVLAAKSLSHAQGGTVFAGWLKLLPVFIMVIPGMISRVLFPNEVACADPDICFEVCQNRAGCSNIALPKMVLTILPTGLKGLMLSVMLAALMSDLTSIFNSASTLFTMDIYHFLRKKAPVRELMIVGRVFVCVMVVISIVWIPVIQGMQGGQLYIYIQSVAAYLSPPIAAVYLIAILWKRGNEKGAFTGLLVGMVVGVVRMALDFAYVEPHCGEEDTRPAILVHFHYMYFALMLFLLSGTIMVVISLLSQPPSKDQIIRTTYWTRHDQSRRMDEELPVKGPLDDDCVVADQGQSDHGDHTEVATEANNKVLYQKADIHSTGDQDDAVMLGNTADRKHSLTEVNGGMPTLTKETLHKEFFIRRTFDWFCGLEDQSGTNEDQPQHNFGSLKQDRRARIGLLVALVTLFAFDIFLFIFFSTGSSLGMF